MRRELDVLVVEDDPAQVRLIRTLVQQLELPHRFHNVSDGVKALDFLNHRPPFEEAARPHLILLDLNMPGINGCEVLQSIKADPRYRSIPVVVLSSSESLNDIQACYDRHANAYIHKPLGLEENLRILSDLDRFWSDTVSLVD